jgi:alkanesulfonate monooxygenase SsuD/methylene tetrahydromethanopterin reductase-like flavin-dependent oxidoreductase (luciferase family)
VVDYWRSWEEHRHDPGRLNGHVAAPRVGIVRQIVVAETDEEAAAVAPAAHAAWYRSIMKLWHDHDDHTHDRLFTRETATQHGTILFGSPARVREQIARLLEVSGCNYVLCVFAWGTLGHDAALRSLRLFADEVMPAFAGRPAPVG